MIIHKLDVVCPVLPPKADPPLVVDTNAVLASAITPELFEPIAWRDPQVVQLLRGIDESQFAEHEPLKLGRETPNPLSMEETFPVAIGETVDHRE